MNEINAVVRRIGEGEVWLESNPASACSRCQGGACSSVSISRLFCSSSRQFKVACSEPLQVGDVVRVGLEEGQVLRAALLAYGLPLLGLMGGAGAASLLWPQAGEVAVIAAGLVSLAAALLVVRLAGAGSAVPRVLGKAGVPIPIVRNE